MSKSLPRSSQQRTTKTPKQFRGAHTLERFPQLIQTEQSTEHQRSRSTTTAEQLRPAEMLSSFEQTARDTLQREQQNGTPVSRFYTPSAAELLTPTTAAGAGQSSQRLSCTGTARRSELTQSGGTETERAAMIQRSRQQKSPAECAGFQ